MARGKSKSVLDGGENQTVRHASNAGRMVQTQQVGERRHTDQESIVSEGQGQAGRAARTARTDSGTVMKITPDELIRLAPRLKPYLAKGSPNWPEIVEAADWLRHDLEVSKPLWGEACLAMGRAHAAIALAIVSTKPVGFFRGSPGGYFHGIVVKARAGDLNLSRTIWGMRSGQEKTPIRGSSIAPSLHKMTNRM